MCKLKCRRLSLQELNHLKGWKLQDGEHFFFKYWNTQLLFYWLHLPCLTLLLLHINETSISLHKTWRWSKIFWTALAGNPSASWSQQCKVLMRDTWLHSPLSTTQVTSRHPCVHRWHQTTTQGSSTLPKLLYVDPSHAKPGDSHSNAEDTLQEERQCIE